MIQKQSLKTATPWQRVFVRFGVSRSELARILCRHRSKVSRILKDPDGIISGHDQVRLLKEAQKRGVKLEPSDLVPHQ